MSGRALAGLALLAALGGSLAWLAFDREAAPAGGLAGAGSGGASNATGTPPGAPNGGFVAAGPASCLPCHAEVVAEWRQSMHAQAFTDPHVRAPDQSDGFARKDCLPCHAPRPVFEFGIAERTRVMARVERQADGVDCLSCHGLPDGVAASRAGLTGACRPVFREELTSHVQCYACHNQHGTHEEWAASPAAAAGQDCGSCHMPRVSRRGEEAGAPRAGRSHRFPGGRDRDHVLAGLELEPRFDASARRLEVRLRNAFAGHNLPTDTRNRALDLVVRLRDARGAELPPPVRETREPGCETGTARLRFRNPYRTSGDPNTQVPAGETAVLAVHAPAEAVAATIELLYKLSPFVPDEDAHWRHAVNVELPE